MTYSNQITTLSTDGHVEKESNMKYTIAITLDLKTDEIKEAERIAKEMLSSSNIGYEKLDIRKEQK